MGFEELRELAERIYALEDISRSADNLADALSNVMDREASKAGIAPDAVFMSLCTGKRPTKRMKRKKH